MAIHVGTYCVAKSILRWNKKLTQVDATVIQSYITASLAQDLVCDLCGVRLEGKVACGEEHDAAVGGVSAERVGAGGDEDGVVLAPDGEHGHAVLPHGALELRVQRDVGRVVAEQGDLGVEVAQQQRVVEHCGRRVDGARGAVEVLRVGGRLVCDDAAEQLGSTVGACPELAHGRPELCAETLLVHVAVLGDDAGDALRVGEQQAEARGGAVVEHVELELVPGEGVDEGDDGCGDGGKGVGAGLARKSEAGQVRGDEVVAVGEAGDEGAEHQGGGRVAVEEEHLAGVVVAVCAVEDVVDVAEGGRRRRGRSSRSSRGSRRRSHGRGESNWEGEGEGEKWSFIYDVSERYPSCVLTVP